MVVNMCSWISRERNVEYEENKTNRFLSQFLTKIIEFELNYNNEFSISEYWKSIGSNTTILYMTKHNEDSMETYSFVKEKGNFNEKDWSKSSRTTALYQQIVKYDNVNVYDITNPIYSKDRKYMGALRIGFKKLYE